MTTPPLIPVSRCPHCLSLLTEPRLNNRFPWRCLECTQKFNHPITKMESLPGAIEVTGDLKDFRDRLTLAVNEMLEVEELPKIDLQMHQMPEEFDRLSIRVLSLSRELRATILISPIRRAMAAGEYCYSELIYHLAYTIMESFCVGGVQPVPFRVFPPDLPSPELLRVARLTLASGLSLSLHTLVSEKVEPQKPSCGTCAYLIRGLRLGEPHICNAFHTVTSLRNPIECPDYNRNRPNRYPIGEIHRGR